VFTHETSGTIVVDDELQGFVKPAVRAVTVPVLTRTLFEGDRGRIVKADDERGGFDGF
jgi:hypothetical protein